MSKAKVHVLPSRHASCPICGKAAAAVTLPFCSTRCRDVDLARWFGESYAIPAVEADPGDFDELEAQDRSEDLD